MMEYDQKHNYVFIHFRDIWSKIESLFHLENDDVISIMKIWLDKEYELEGVTPDSGDITTTDEFGSKLEVI
jgi:pantothenate kinase-related protein Tda10